jgi:two-component system cell cycle response regulator
MSRIIHVDNSNFFRKLVGKFLSELGHDNESYARGEDALRAVKSDEVSYVITGFELADMSGENLVKRIKSFSSKQPVIVLTSLGRADAIERLEALGVKAIIQKSSDWKTELRKILR